MDSNDTNSSPKAETQRALMLRNGYLTANESADRVGVNVATVYRMISSEKVKTCKAGKLTYIYALSLAEHYKEAPPIYARIMKGIDASTLTGREGTSPSE